MRLLLLVFTCFCFSLQPIWAQEYDVVHYTDENGLPQNSVKSIATDDAGFVWLATENGPVRFDGQKFLLFDKNYTKAFSNRIINFRKDLNHNQLFALTENWQLVPIQKGRVKGKPIGYDDVFQFQHGNNTTHYFASGLPNILGSYFAGAKYIIPIGKQSLYEIFNQKISLYQQNKLVYTIAYPYKDQWRFFLIGEVLYYLDEDYTLSRFINGSEQQVKLLGEINNEPKKAAHQLFWNNVTQHVFISIGSRLYALNIASDGKNIQSKCILNYPNFNFSDILTIYSDPKTRHTYLGSYTKGLYVFKEKGFKAVNPDTSATTTNFYAQYAFGKDEVLYANGYLFKNTGKAAHLNLVRKTSGNFALLIDQQKNIWTADGSTLVRLTPEGTKIVSKHQFTSRINSLYQDQKGEIWIGTFKGVFKMSADLQSFAVQKGLERVDDVSYLQRVGNELWIGTSKGIFSFNIATTKTFYIKWLKNKQVRSIYARNKEIWITTFGDGFYLYKDKKLTHFPNDANNYLNNAHCILEDKYGFFWISSNKGLFKVSINDLKAYAAHQTNEVFYLYYNKSYGFKTNEFNGGCQPCATILNNGDFTFPTINGIVLFDPAKIVAELPDQPIFIDKIVLDNKEIDERSTLQLPIGFDRLTIYLSTPYYGNSENLNFEYKLGSQQVWTKSTDQTISYTSLPTGNNELIIRKKNGFGVQNFAYQTIHIFIPPHFYQTWWFITAVILFSILIVFLLIKARTKRVRKRNRQLEENIFERTQELQSTIKAYEISQKRIGHQFYFQRRLIAAITHDIKSPLRYLMMTGEALYKSEKNKPVDEEGLKAIYTSSTQIYHFTANLLEYAKGFTNEALQTKTKFNLHHLVEEKIAIFQSIANTHSIRIDNLVKPDTNISSNKQLLSVILHNLLDNAVKFTSVGEISFDYETIDNCSKIMVKDSGKGMKPNQVTWCNEPNTEEMIKNKNEIDANGGLGLIIVKELLQMIDGQLYVEAEVNKGTSFEITLWDVN